MIVSRQRPFEPTLISNQNFASKRTLEDLTSDAKRR